MSAADGPKRFHRNENYDRSGRLARVAIVLILTLGAIRAFGQAGDPVLSFGNVTTLKAYSTATFGSTVPQALTAGYHLAGDGGGNRFFWSATSTAADNGGTVIHPASVPPGLPGRWIAVAATPINAKVFGAKGDGTADDSPALTRAIQALSTGELFLPAGTYKLGSTILLTGIGKTLRGEGENATFLKADIGVTTAVQLGDSGSYFQGRVSNLQITRASGTVTSAMSGILAERFNYTVLEDVVVNRQGTGVKTGAGLGLDFNRVRIHDALTHVWLRDVAEIIFNVCNFGSNGPESIAPNVLLLIDGGTNDVRIKTAQFIPRANPNSTVAIKWINSPALSTGYYRFDDINMENLATGFQSDTSCAVVVDLQVTNSRLTTNGKVFDFNPATVLANVAINNNSIHSTHACTITNTSHCRFGDNHINGGFTFSGGDLSLTSNTLTTDVVFSGFFGVLVANDNILAFNRSAPITFNLSGASGKIMMQDNAADAGTQPESRSP